MDVGQLVRVRADPVYNTSSSTDPRVVRYANVIRSCGSKSSVVFVVDWGSFYVVCYAYT